jgi:transposase
MKQSTSKQRKERTARKLDRKAALEQHARGLSTTEISKIQGVNPSTVWRFLDRSEPHRQLVEDFKRGRGNEFATLQAKSMALQHKILDTFDDGTLAAMTTHQKTGLVSVLSAQAGTLYDKERLETGKSTQNHSVIARMMGDAVRTAHADPAQAGEAAVETEE